MKKVVWLLIGILLVATLACSFGSKGTTPTTDDGQPAQVATTAPSDDQAAPTEEATQDQGGADDETISVDTGAFSELQSYRARIEWTVAKADGTTDSFSMEQAATRDPAASQFSMTSNGESIEYIQIGDQTYMKFGEDWMQTTSGDDSSDFGDMLTSTDDWLGSVDESEYKYLGKETINGINTRHYQADYNDSWLGLGSLFGAGTTVDSVTDGTVDVWVADESDLPDFVVRSVIEINGTFDEQDGTVTLTQETYDVNTDFTIEAPAAAELGGLPEGLETYPGATDVTSFGSMTMFTAPDDVATVNDYYVAALEAAGWTEGEDSMVTEELASSTWTLGGDTLTLMVSSGDDGTSVMISVESAQ